MKNQMTPAEQKLPTGGILASLFRPRPSTDIVRAESQPAQPVVTRPAPKVLTIPAGAWCA